MVGCERWRGTSPEQDVVATRDDFVILASCDTRGWIEPCGCASGQSGGLSRRATLMNQLAGGRDTLLVSVGGASSGGQPYDTEKLRAILAGESAMGYEIHNLGATELLTELPDAGQLTYLSTNVSGFDARVEPFVELTKGGWKVLVLGVISRNLAPLGLPFEIQSPEESILRTLEVSDHDVDAVLVLAYMDREELTALAANLPEVDVIIGGHTGQSMAPIQVGRTLATAVSNHGKFIARVTAHESDNLARPSLRWSADLHEVSEDLAENELQLANLKAFRERLERLDFSSDQTSFATRRGSQPKDADRFVGSAACENCHVDDVVVWKNSTHSHAWKSLEDVGAHVDSFCQQCHTTGYGLAGGFFNRANSVSQHRIDVGCESCHGPSSGHLADVNKKTPWQAGNTCLSCHDRENSPSFEYEAYWSRIAHGTVEPKDVQ